jgi:hypothetical protein
MKLLRHRPLALAVFCAALTLSSLFPSVHAANEKPPAKMTFQGFLTATDGTPLGNASPETKVVQFKIYDASTGGTLLRTEEQTVTLDKGHFSVLLGEGTISGTVPTLTAIFQSASASDRYLELVVDGSAMTPRIQFVASPYALLAGSANQLIDAAGNAVLIPTSGGGGLTVNGKITATTGFSGDGSALTALNGANITAGTVADSKLATISTAGKVANSATTATSANTANAIVTRDASGNFTAGTITANGSALTALNGANITAGTVPDSKLATLSTAGKVANSATTATSANTANAIVTRDASGNFTAGTVTASAVNVNGLPAVAADAPFRIVAGSVNANGTISAGTGFTVTRIFAGYYRVIINNSSTTPFVTANAYDGGPATAPGVASTIEISQVGNGLIDFFTFNGVRVDKAFHFIALVPR